MSNSFIRFLIIVVINILCFAALNKIISHIVIIDDSNRLSIAWFICGTYILGGIVVHIERVIKMALGTKDQQ